MLRKLLDYQLSLTKKGKPLHRIKPLLNAGDTFLYEAPDVTKRGPHIRDFVDIKRWMLLVVVALLPCILMAIWNSGLQSFVYSSGDFRLMDEFMRSTNSLGEYFAFASKEGRFWTILQEGLFIFLPLALVTYTVGGAWEALFACVRGHEISEGFLVTGILFVLIMPPTLPLWMAAVGVSFGIILGKEVFGGSGMNIVNPALTCRAFLFFAYPGKMTGNVWVGRDPSVVRSSLIQMNEEAGKSSLDGYTQATELNKFNITPDIKQIHIDAIATNNLGENVRNFPLIENKFFMWSELSGETGQLGDLTQETLQSFVTASPADGGLGLGAGYFEEAFRFTTLQYGLGTSNDWGFFLGNKLGCLGETSGLACLLGALFLVISGVGSWRTMAGMALGAFLTAFVFQFFSSLTLDGGAWAPAQFGLPAYKHLLLGGLAFGLVFMATDPVSSPDMNLAKWVYGVFCGIVTLTIRTINPAYPEGVMLAILMGNVFAPLFDHYAAKYLRRRKRVRATSS